MFGAFFDLKVYSFKAENIFKSCIPVKIKQADLFARVSESQYYPLGWRQLKKKLNRFSCPEGYSERQILK